MAHPKSRTSKSRRNKRRSHNVIQIPAFRTCKVTGINYVPHTTYIFKDNIYYKGKMIIKNKSN